MKMALKFGILCFAMVGLSRALVCPDGSMCEDKHTCCKNTVGGYGCCPLPHAECCSDHLHCCYEGTLCDLVHKKCVNKTVSLPWMKRLPSKQALPVAEAACCQDKRHCCPKGTKCDTTRGICVSASLESFPMLKKVPATQSYQAATVNSVTCPGGKSSCPDRYTCCLLNTGDYGCCPYPEATCCSDHLHCCPSNTICDLEHGVCRFGETKVPLLKKIHAVLSDVECPGKTAACPDQTTCCQTTNGSYGCCPMPNAVCCSDHTHCCPEGTRCDLYHSTCVLAPKNPTVALKLPATVMELELAQNKVGAVPCNDSVACADGHTCCKTPVGAWACCPLPEAVCCEDHLHCCPHGTICNLAASTCDQPTGSDAAVPWVKKVPSFPLATDDCECGQATCCKTATGDWACCPLPQAVCCGDHIHCCPHGTVCNLEAETCDDPSGFAPSFLWTGNDSTLPSDVQDETCDRKTKCPGGTTCCEKNAGQWACCPLPQAICCNDHEHCCPKGYTCNVAEQTCETHEGLKLAWLQKIPALAMEPSQALPQPAWLSQNMCDAHTSCPKDTTCCFMDKTHKWGCCPLPNAVCCSDGTHCCPSGHTCEPHRTSCSKGPHVIPWFTKTSALTEPGTLTDVKCDNKTSCASGTTCCKLPTGAWGCCPLVKAVCCADHEHCCPQGYTCNMETGTCEKKNHNVLLQMLRQSKVKQCNLEEAGDNMRVPCDSTGDFSCPRQETCCKMSDTEWTCCPSPRAICCPDSKHCCPSGYTCDLKAGGCILKRTQLTWDSLFEDRKRRFVSHGP